MDTSETYIEMCEKAEEIQPKTKPLTTISDYIFIDKAGSFWHQTGIWSTDWNAYWLPRQDQLQEMLPDIQKRESDLIDPLLRMILDDFYKMEKWKTWEQLWLAFVMEEKYDKVWTGEQWEIV